MKWMLTLGLAVVAFAAIPFLGSSPARAGQCEQTLIADVNPSAVGQEVTFDFGCVFYKPSVTYWLDITDENGVTDTVRVSIGGWLGTFEPYTFTAAGEYDLVFYNKRANGNEWRDWKVLATATQTVQ